ncbi:Ig-like domain-containing protein [Escherichia coli]
MSLIIDVISRKTSVKQTLINPGDVTVVIYEPSVVQVHAQASAVARYVREGNDLLIYMQDGTVIRCNGYFLQAANTAEQSELVFADGQQLTHVTFADTAAGGLAPVELTAQTTAIESIAPFLDTVAQTSTFPWGWLAGAAVGGGALGALLASGGDGDSKTEVINNPTPPAEPGNATPSFLVTDNQGDQRGILATNDITDDTTPTFSGSGQAGATIQIKDSNGNTIASTQVDNNGQWSVSLPTQSAGEHTWSVVQIVGSTITDAGSITLTIDNSQASVQVATTAGDNIINASEQAAGFTFSGTSSHLAQGTELTVTLNGKTYTTSVGANGAWSVQVPTADAQALGEGNQAVLVSGKDATGNTVTGAQLLTVDTQPPTLAINTIAQDNIISAAEHNVALVLSGTSNAEAGQTVTLTVNGKSHTATVGSDGTWQVTLPATEVQALAEGNYAVNASVSDRAGNTTSHSANFTVDTSAPVVSVNTVAGDDILNNAEQAVAQIISGQVSGASPGDTVTVKLGTHVLTGIVLADGSWNVALDPAVTRTLDRGANTIFVTVTDAAGNTGAASRAITLVGVSPLITINTVSGDDIISGAEKGAPLTLTGSTQQAETGQTVTVTLAGQSFTTTVQADGSWSLTVPAAAMGNLPDGAVAITASVTDLSGNTGNTSRTITVDSQAPALSIDSLTADNIINAAESGQDLPITGTTDAQPGQTVTVTLNGQTYQGVVQSDGTWSVTVPAANVDALADGNATVTASVNDVAGNPTSVSRVALVDATPPVVTINPVATDNVINTPEHTQAQIISGTVTGAQAGDIVTVTLNNVNYTTVVDGSGNWSLGVPASVVSGLVDGSYPVNVSVTDRAGNMGSQSLTVTVNTAAPLIGINSIAGDDVINASEKGADVQITGTSDQPVNTAITVTLNGQNYTTTTDASGNWSVTVPASAVTALGQANYTVTAAVTSGIGNSATASHNVLVDSALPGMTINPVATDDVINAAEAGVAQTISGQVTGAAVGDTVTITLDGNTYTTTVQANLSWSVSVPAADIQALGNGDLTVSASVTNQNGNTGSGTRDITIDANLPGLRVDTVAGDDVVNIIEHGQALVVTGSSSGLAEGTPLTVTINNVEYTTAVQADGSWSVGVTAAQVSAWPAGTVNIAVSGESSAGNPVNITHPVMVDLTPAAITINTIATDDVINAAEKGADLTLSGTTTNVEAGQTVTVTFGGKNYTASVASDGSWSATVPAADLAALPEGSASAQASVSNINGNSASAVHNYSVDSSAPTIIINTVASDNIVNASEADAGVTVSGSTTAEAGQIVTVTLNSPTVQTYQATVQADGSWSINIPAADLEALTDGSHTLTATVNDKAGNPASTTHNLAVDLTVPVLTINIIAGDDIINATEHGQALVISGSSTGGEAGDVVSVTLNNKTYTTTLDASGNWSVGVPAADVTALGSGPQTITASITDAAGNSDDASRTVTVNLTAPTIGINTIATDDVINATEKGADLQISGTSNQPAGTTITLTLNGQNYTATTDAAGNWSTTVPASAVGALGEASYTVTANVTDSAGNSNSSSHNVQVNTALPGVTINPVATDDIINAAESGVAQTISGQVTGAAAGDTVTVTLGGKTYTATVQGNLSWSVDVPAADIQAIGNGELTVNASVTNGVGNTGSGSRDIVIDANLPGLRVDTVAGDDVVNSIEHGQALVITGSSSGLAAGAALTVVINTVTYAATVLADGTWSLGVPAADVGNWPAGTVNITVSGATSAGNPVTITHPVTVDLAAVAISINTVSGDDVINAAEKGADLTLSGSTSGVEPGQTVTVIFGGKTYTATVAGDGSWTTSIPAADLAALRDGDATVQASVSTINGNTASATHAYSVDATAPTLAINTIATDDILNAAEAGNPLTISGSSSAEAGQTVTVTLNGVTYTGIVQADGSWSVSVPTADLSNLTASQYTVSASVSDKAGNPASATHGLAVDLTVPVLTINTVSGDDIINAAEHGQALVISGSSTGGEAGDVITVTLNSKTYTTTLDASGNWSVGVPLSDVTALGSGPQTITATITDAAGNSDDASRTVTVNLTAPTIGINTIASDDVINATEKGAVLQITGTSNQPAGTTITVTLNGQNYTATTDSSGNWSATVPASAASALGEANYTVTASVTDTAGNSNSASHNVLVNSALPAVTINAVATDDIINAAEAGNAQTISGQVTGAAAGDTVTVTLGGNTYTATVQANLSWSVSVPAADIQALGNGDLTVNASVTNVVGNSGSGSRDITIDANLPGLRVDTVAGDDVINSIEHNQALVITGSSSGLTAGTALTVEINNVTYGATVLADGTWSLGVPAADVSNWPAGTVDITVSGTNSAGTTSTITHPVTVDLAAVAITINTLSGDDVINAVEKGETLVVSGSTSGVEAGQTVTVSFGGKNYTTTVESNGSWTVNVPPADLASLPDGAGNVQASVSNINGNSAQADRAYSVDATAPLVTINTIASDDILNVSEAGAGITISGTTTAQAGQTLTVTLNNNTYQTTVLADGTWSVNVPATDLSGLTASSYTVTATVSDKAGNPASADHALAVDVTAPDLTINTVAGDDIINAIEHGQALVISGTSTGAAAGDVVTVNLNGKNYTTTLDASGNWTVGIPAADVTALATGSQTITASLSDRAGNSDSTTHDVTVDLSGPTLTINTVSDDDIINSTEKTQDLIISGGSSGLATGTTVTVMLNGLAYSATTDSSGNWSVTVPASAVGALGEAVYSISASATDSADNSGSTTHSVNVESLLPGVIINTVAGDDIINAAEIAVAQTISGQVTGTAVAGNTVIVTIGGNQYTATVQSDLSWSVSVPANVLQALGNGELTISASVTNSANNTGTATHDIVIDANLPGLRVDTVAGDDVINSIEHTQALVVTGSSSGLAAGAALTVVINSVTYGATVLVDGSWSVGVPAADVTNWPAGTVNIAVSGTNTAGTTTSITHPVTVDLATVAITINTLSTDDVINAAEKGSDLQLSGTTSGVEVGQTITVIFGGKSYTTTVATGGTWGLTIPAADLATLPDGAANVQASVSSVAGNSAQATHAYSVDATAPSVTINTIATDDVLNADEAGSALTISGTSTAEAGQTVTVTLNGVNYSGNVQADGSWSVSVPTGDLANLTASSYTVNASVSDKAGNPASATHNLTVDLAAPVVTINTVAGDDIINATEHGQAQIISGSATGATTGNTVSVTIGTTTYTTVLDANGNWSIGVPASVISALAQGDVTITVTVTDSAGNSGTASHTVTVALGSPVLAINTIAVDDIINATEKGADLAISGTSDQPAGTQITVTLNGQNYTTTADASGNWSVTVPASRVSALGEATYTVTAAATDADGNSGSASHNVQVNTALPGVTINVVATDDIINAAEAGADQTINGLVTGAAAGDTVTVTLGGATYTATVQADFSWSINVPAAALQALGNGELTISASVTNSVGNTGNGTREITIDANLPGLRVDTVAGDDVVNIIEHGQALVITGSSSGLATGSNVTLTINGQTYVAAVLADGSWSVGVPAVDVSAWPVGTVTITASGSTTAGNPVSVTHPVTVDLSAIAVSINAITADDVINAAEKGAALTLTGSTSGVEAGQTVTVTFGGKTYTASVAANGSWSTTVPAADMAALRDGDASAQASVSNVNGNSATTTHAYSVDASAPTVTINTIAGDDILNAAEAGAALTITGSSTAEAGQTVTVTLNGENYTSTVQTDGSWSVSVPPADLSALTASNYTVSAAVSDKAGNPASVNHNLTVDTSVPVVTINTVAGDDVINATEHAQAQIISGSATGAATGSTVTVTIGSSTFTTVLDASGNWSVGVPASVVSALANGTVTINASVTDAAGNSGSATHQVTVNTGLPSITFNAISGDNVLNADEKGQPLTISGSSTGLATGAQVTVTLNGHNYSATTDAAGNWTLTVPVSDLAALGQANYTVSASATSAAGNTASSQANLLVDSGLPGVTINTVAGDDIINAAEAGADQTISGVVTRAAAGDTVTVTLGGNTYTATVQSNLSWSVSVPAADLQALGNGDLTITASVTNANGNTGSGTRDITIDANLPGLRVDTVAGDDIVNSIEHGQALVITGGSSGLNAGAVLTVTINSVAYSTTVQADGSWSVGIPAANVSAWPAGALTVEVAGQSSAGNPVSVSHPFTVDLTAVAISINTIASDDVINAAEKGTGLTLSGSTSGIESGQTVTVTFGGKTYTASVAANGSWSVTVPAADLATLPDGAANVQASVSSASGNSASATHAYSVDASAPTLTINTIASDDILNATEAGSPLTISGTSTAEIGQTVTVTLNGTTYTGNVQADGSWSVSVPTSALGALTASNYTVSATVNDKAGNPGSASHNLAVDTTAPVLTINTVAGDDIINDAEHAQALVISGTSTAETGQTLTVTLNGTNYQTTVQADGSWSLTLPASDLTALANNGYTLTATVSDQAGNPGSASKGVTVDTTAPVISFNTVAGDDVINNVEHTQAQIISGTATGAVAGDRLVVTIAGQQYVTSTDASGNWSVGVPASVISGLADGTVTISATITDSAGNSSTQTHNVQVNTAAVSLSVSTISGDNLINAAEAGSALTLSGTGTNFAAGTVVTVLLNGKGYSATIQNNGSWSVNVPAADVAALADGTSYTVSASAQDSAGNSATASRSVAVDLTAPVISINTVSTDDRLNAAEQQQPLTLNGSTSAEVGQTVTVTFGGKTYTATVAANGTWALNVPAADLAALGQGAQTITASVNDRAGNPGQTTHALTVDTVAPTVTIATVAGDDIINNAEQLAGQTISGTTTAEVGQTVTVTFNGQTWTATVGSGGSWSVFIPAQQFAGLSDGSYTISATVSDQAGNPGSASRGVTLNGDVPSVTINTFAGDDVVNAAEHGSSLVISGTTTAPVGQTLTLTLNGKTYTTTVQTGGSWSYTLGSADVTALADGNAYVINASVSNAIGNTGSSNHTITVDLSAPAMGINIDSLQADTGLSASDFITSVSPVVVNGSLTAALASNETAQISIDGGVTWTTLTVTGTTWRYNDSRTLTDGNYLYQVRVIDTAGNVGATDSQNVVIDTIAPDPAVKTIAISAITTDTGLITNDFVTSDTTLAVSGTLGAALSAGEFAQISIDGGSTWQNLSVSGLTWTYLDGRTLTDGNYNYQVRVIDTAGNIGATASQIVTVDTTAPLASKTIAIAGISDDTGLSSSDFVTRDTTLTVRGTLGAALAADERAQISLDGGVTWTTLTVIGTNWSYADGRTLTDGTWNYTVRVVDLAGNVGQTATQNVVVDTTSPEAAKSITITGISDDTGASSSDFITSDTTLTVRGVLGAALGANEFAQISTDNGATWVNVTLAADGLNWSYVDGRTLTNGTTTWQVRVVDLAGNVGATGSQSAQIDTVNPAQVLTIASISTDTGSSATDFITSDTSLTLTGSLGAGLASGEVAQISLDGGATWTTLTTNGTQWTYTDSRTLTDGSYVYQVRVLDLAGNTGPVVSKTVVVDTINPTATPTIVSYTDDVGQRQGTLSSSQATDDTTPLLNGVLSAPLASGEVVYLYRNGLLLGAVTMVGALNWTYSDSGLVSGAYTYSARVVDLAGNITSSSDFVLTVDTSIPTTLAQITSQTTRDTTPIISGVITAALASGQYVEVVINGKTYTSQPGGAVVVDPAHNTWYVQLPDTDTLAASATAYNVTAQVKSSAGNGNTANVSTGTVTVNAAIDYTPTWTTASKSTAWGLTYGLDSHGMWTVLANQQVMQSTDPLTWSKTALTLYQSGNNYATSSIADYDRNGTGDLFITRDDYGTGYINGFTNNGDGTFSSAIQVTVGTLTWYGSIVAFDKEGDGYLDFWIGDAGGPDSNTFLWNNAGTLVGNSTTSNSGGSATVGGAVTGYLSLNEGSGVDLNNDGRIDLVQHTYNLNNYYTLSSLINQGNGTFVWGQNTINTFLSTAGSGGNSTSVSMTWADFDGDGDMDLFLPASQGRANYGSLLFNTNGVLGSPVAVGATATTYASQFSLAVDWNHDGLMDIARIAQTGQSYLYTNVGGASNWTQSTLGGSQSGTTSGVAAMDYDWDGAVDVLVTKQSGSVFLIRNTNTVSYGTSLHLRITDPNGINVYYGNTVKLYNSAGVLVATQIINPQSGMGVNDTSALVNFYGLNAGETYNAVLIKSTGTTASNIDQTVNTSWGGLQATDATHAYDLSAEAGTVSNNGKFVGTGYNDTFFATAGTDTYDGSGGWVYSSGTGTWLANGGMDVVDFRLSTVGVTANLSSTAAQATGFNTSTFTNIEGISGSNFNDTLTGSSGDNQLEGRGGNDTLNIGNGGHDTLLYKLLNASDATGGNGSDVVNGFTVGTWEGTADTDRIDIRELLQGSGYTGNGKASYVNGVATLDAQAGNIGDFVKVTQSGSDTIVQIDRDGTGGNFATANVVTLTGVHTDLATLLANHQLMVV